VGSAILGGREFRLPILVPSVSSFETPINLTGAISIQFALQEPISLVSAFDFHNEEAEFKGAATSFAKTGILLVDSGGYESQRIRRSERYYKTEPKPAIDWSERIFFDTLKSMNFHYAFSYDYHHKRGNLDAYREVLFRGISQHLELVGTRVIPVIHSVDEPERGAKPIYLSDDQLIQLCLDVAKAFAPDFIAIPERELGHGVAGRARLAKRIVDELGRKNQTRIHLLGCGNPLSSALFAAAGVSMVDGLEWCRTYFCDPMWLTHFQHEGVLPPADELLNPGAKQLLSGNPNYEDRVAVHNLLALQRFSIALSEALEADCLPAVIENAYGPLPAALAQELLE
jgi:hypothetical protein